MPAMPASDRAPDGGHDHGPDPAGLVVAPFRGLRYDPSRVVDLAAVTSPPYDVIDPDSAVHLEELDPHNVVRLILPRDGTVGAAAAGDADGRSRYLQAGAALDRWTTEGILCRDDEPALYVYEQAAPGVLQRGLLAAVGLRDPSDGVILPHEDVMPGPVADRLELMRATSANLEPILLAYDGGGETARVVDGVCASEPLLATTTEDGWLQRVWAVTDVAVHERVARDMAPRTALIADGHHRYATYRRLQAEHHDGGDGPGDWDLGLAMLVDSRSHPLRVQAIHRVVAGLPLTRALEQAGAVFRVGPDSYDLRSALHALDGATGRHPFVITDGDRYTLVEDPEPSALEDAMPAAAHSADWRALDASVLHSLLLSRLWQVDDDSRRTMYLHDASSAVRQVARSAGVAVLMRPVGLGVVQAMAARGERMPRKSTSFGPKPRTGLVMRLLDR